jgi:L-threonylcarbamoyladenylate synthase
MGMSFQEAIEAIRRGGIGIMPTDTLYGLVGSALSTEAMERIYAVRRRDHGKPLIVLVADAEDVERFDIVVSSRDRELLAKWWPGKVSVALPCVSERFRYLHRGSGALAFRCPDVPELRALLREVGPLVAPSANPQGEPPAETIEDARRYFGESVDFYVDGGRLSGEPSTLVRLSDGSVEVLRRGAVRTGFED